MAKKRTKKEATIQELQQRMREHMRGGGAGKKDSNLNRERFCTVGIPIPLAFQWLIDNDYLPLGFVYQLTGESGSRKTTLAIEMLRWIANHNGISDFVLTEGKFSHSLAKSLCGYPGDEFYAPIEPYQSVDIQDWQTRVSGAIERFNKDMDKGGTLPNGVKIPPKFVRSPMGFVVDSVVAQLTQQQTTQIQAEGGQPRGFAVHVKSISDWISQVQAAVTARPYLLALINHCTVDYPENVAQQYATPTINEKGGRKLKYESSLVICMKSNKTKTRIINEPGWAPEEFTNTIKLWLNKSSIGSDHRKLDVSILSRTQQLFEDGEAVGTQQRSFFLWGKALVDILLGHMYSDDSGLRLSKEYNTAAASARYREPIQAVVPFKVESPRTIYCEKYQEQTGTTQYGYEEFGNLLSQDPEFVKVFHALFAIKRIEGWAVGENYFDAMERAKQRSYLAKASVPE